jgi:hypothetical protein
MQIEAASKIFRERPLWTVILLCLAVRFAEHAWFGVSFDMRPFEWQLLDIARLRDHPWQSLYLMHMQPPLFNGLLALSLVLPAAIGGAFLSALYLMASMAMVGIVYYFLRRFGLSPVASAAAGLLFGLLPQVLFFESYFLYTHLEAALLLAAMFFASRYLSDHGLADLVGLAATLVVLALLRTLFHVAWVAVTLIVVWGLVARRDGWNARAFAVTILAIAIAALPPLKNLKEFGFFSTTSWQGLSIANMALPLLPGDSSKFPSAFRDFEAGLSRGEFSPAASQAAATPILWLGWRVAARDCPDNSEKRPVLCSIEQSNGRPNFNHREMIAYSREIGRDARRFLWRHPEVYLGHAMGSGMLFLGVPSWIDAGPLVTPFQPYTAAWEALLLYRQRPQLSLSPTMTIGGHIVRRLGEVSWPVMAFVIFGSLVIVLKAIEDVRLYWRGVRGSADWVLPALALMLFATVPNLVNGIETNRIRYSIEPMLYLAVIQGLVIAVRTARSRLRH